MNRQIVYPGAIPRDLDILSGQKNAMVALGNLISALFTDSAPLRIDGFACTPGTGLQVTVAAGRLFASTLTDVGAYGTIPLDGHIIGKVGVSPDPVNLPCPAPVTVGHSIAYLVEADFTETDGNPIILPYYNPADPTSPLNGQGGNNVAQNTTRNCDANVYIKAGVSAPTGTEAIPGPTSGRVGLWVVTIAYGASSVVSGNIAAHGNYAAYNVGAALIERIKDYTGLGSGMDADTFRGLSPAEVYGAWRGVSVFGNDLISAPMTDHHMIWHTTPLTVNSVSAFSGGTPEKLTVPAGVSIARVRTRVSIGAVDTGHSVIITLKFFKAGTVDLVNGQYASWLEFRNGDGVNNISMEVGTPAIVVEPGDWFWVTCTFTGAATGGFVVGSGSYFTMEVLG